MIFHEAFPCSRFSFEHTHHHILLPNILSSQGLVLEDLEGLHLKNYSISFCIVHSCYHCSFFFQNSLKSLHKKFFHLFFLYSLISSMVLSCFHHLQIIIQIHNFLYYSLSFLFFRKEMVVTLLHCKLVQL